MQKIIPALLFVTVLPLSLSVSAQDSTTAPNPNLPPESAVNTGTAPAAPATPANAPAAPLPPQASSAPPVPHPAAGLPSTPPPPYPPGAAAGPFSGYPPGIQPPDSDAVPGQEQITRALQDDILFERQRRQLANELALAKLRAELQKIRQGGDSDTAIAMSAMPLAVDSVAPPLTLSAPSATPQILLVSQVAGVSRIAVSVGDSVRLVSPHATFSVNGKRYRVQTDKKKQYVLRELP